MTLRETYHTLEIKKLLVERSEQFRIPLRYICKEARLDYQEFMRGYINRVDSSEAKITEKQFEKILSLLGVSVRFVFVVDEKFTGKDYEQNNNTTETEGVGEVRAFDFDPE